MQEINVRSYVVCKVLGMFLSVFEAIVEDVVSAKSDSKWSFVPWITNLSKNQ